MTKTFLKNILKRTAILTLSCVLSSSNTFASDMPDEEKQLIEMPTSTSVVALPSNNTIFSPAGHVFGVQEEIALLNKSLAAVEFLNSENFKNALNNVLTWASYNESKRLYQQYGDKCIAPLADTLINTNFSLAKSLILKTTGLTDIVKAIGILTGDKVALPKEPSTYIRENFSQSFFDICRLKFLTDVLNEQLIAPHIVAPCFAYAVHKTDIAGILQQHIVSNILTFLEQQKPEIEKKAHIRLDVIDSEILKYSHDIQTVRENIKSWETLPEAIQLQISITENTTKLQMAQNQIEDQKKVVDDECKKMSTVTYYINYLPGTSTKQQKGLYALSNKVNEILATQTALKKKQEQIKSSLEYQVGLLKKERRDLKKEKNLIHKGLKGEDIRSRTISLTNAFATGFFHTDEEEPSDDHSVFDTTCAGMTLIEMIQPCPHINYQYLEWISSLWTKQETHMPEETSQSPFVQILSNTATQVGTFYFESTGVTKAASDIQCQFSQKKIHKNTQKLFEIYEKGKQTSHKNAQARAKILEDNDVYKITKALHLGGAYFQEIKDIVFNYANVSFFMIAHADLLKRNVTSLGNALRTAARPFTVGFQALKYTAPVWAIGYITSYTLGVSIPYGTSLIVPLSLGIMDDFNLWGPALEHVTNAKNSLSARLTHARTH